MLLSREWPVKSEHLLPELKLVDWLIMQVVRIIFVGTMTLWFCNIVKSLVSIL